MPKHKGNHDGDQILAWSWKQSQKFKHASPRTSNQMFKINNKNNRFIVVHSWEQTIILGIRLLNLQSNIPAPFPCVINPASSDYVRRDSYPLPAPAWCFVTCIEKAFIVDIVTLAQLVWLIMKLVNRLLNYFDVLYRQSGSYCILIEIWIKLCICWNEFSVRSMCWLHCFRWHC